MTREHGQVSVLLIGLTLVALAVAGIAVDGTRAFLLRRTLQNAADAAALAGAAEVNRSSYYQSGGKSAELDMDAARHTAAAWLARRGVDARSAIAIDPAGVRVILRSDARTTLLRVVGIGAIPVGVEAWAEPFPSP